MHKHTHAHTHIYPHPQKHTHTHTHAHTRTHARTHTHLSHTHTTPDQICSTFSTAWNSRYSENYSFAKMTMVTVLLTTLCLMWEANPTTTRAHAHDIVAAGGRKVERHGRETTCGGAAAAYSEPQLVDFRAPLARASSCPDLHADCKTNVVTVV